MKRSEKILAGAMLCALAGPAAAVDDGAGKDWRQLRETTGLSWNQVASICPRDGVTPCSGSVGGKDLTTWVWATDKQVIRFMGRTEPAILTAEPHSLFGAEWFFSGLTFLEVMAYTYSFATIIDYYEFTGGLTSSLDASGLAVGGSADWGYYPISGGLGVGPFGDVADADPYVGVWVWRPIGPDYWPPIVTPSVTGVIGNNGWYVSNAQVTFDVQDPESEITARVGCDPITVNADTFEVSFTCQATSEGGTSSASAFVKRDATAPTLTCQTPAPVFTVGVFNAQVVANVADATSGPNVSPVGVTVNTNTVGSFTATVAGFDRAGIQGTVQCPYQVTVPLCAGLTPTIVGTGNPDTITGTGGRDIIAGVGGNDTINGGGGNDVICAGEGSDLVFGDAGNDVIYGEAGNDDLKGGNGADNLDGGSGEDSIRGDGGSDLCTSGEIRMSSCTPY